MLDGYGGSSVGNVVAILVMFVHSVAGISTGLLLMGLTHSDVGDRIND